MRRLRSFASSFPAFRYVSTLSGVEYLLRYRWSARAGSWYLDVCSSDGTALVAGSRVVVSFPLLEGHRSPSLPPDLLLALDLEGLGREIQEQGELGDRVRLCYVTREELGQTSRTSPVLRIEAIP